MPQVATATINAKPEPLNLDQAKALGKLKQQAAAPQTPFTPSRYLTFPDDTPRTGSFPKFNIDNIDPALWPALPSAGPSGASSGAAPKSPSKLDMPRFGTFSSSLRNEVDVEGEGTSAAALPSYLPSITFAAPGRSSPFKPNERRGVSTAEMLPPASQPPVQPPDTTLNYDYRRGSNPKVEPVVDPSLQEPAHQLTQLAQLPNVPTPSHDHHNSLQAFRYPTYPIDYRRRDTAYRYPPAPYVAANVRDTVTPNAFNTWSRPYAPSPERFKSPDIPAPAPAPAATFDYSPGPSQGTLPVEYGPAYQLPQPYGYQAPQASDDGSELIYPAWEGGARARQRDPISIDNTPVPPQWAGMSGYWGKGVIHTWHTGVKPSPTVFRICAQCHTDKPGAKTWRRSKLQKETTLCNKCGIYEHTHHKPRPKRHGDHQFELSDRAHAETYAYMSTPRSNRSTGRKVDSPGSHGHGPVFGVVGRRRKPYDRGGDEEDWRP